MLSYSTYHMPMTLDTRGVAGIGTSKRRNNGVTEPEWARTWKTLASGDFPKALDKVFFGIASPHCWRSGGVFGQSQVREPLGHVRIMPVQLENWILHPIKASPLFLEVWKMRIHWLAYFWTSCIRQFHKFVAIRLVLDYWDILTWTTTPRT